MLAPRQELPSKPARLNRLMRLGRWASVLALVTALSGFGIATADSGSANLLNGSTDQYSTTVAAQLTALEGLRAQPVASPSPMPSPVPVMAAPAAADTGADDEEMEEEEEEGQEDGLLPGGQAEQRSQGLGDKAEARDEDHENQP